MALRRGLRSGPLPFLAGLLVLYLLVPIGVLLAQLPSSRGAFSAPGLWSAVWVSLLTASISTAVIAGLGIPLGWALARGSSRLGAAVGIAVQLPLALPPLMSGILLIEVVGPYTMLGRLFGGDLTDTTAAIVLAQTFVASPFLIIAARSAFRAVDPALEEVAATLGHGSWSRFRRVSLPLAWPGIRAGLLLAWLRAFGEFGATIILAYHPYSLPVFTWVQFSSTGLTPALGPTAAALVAAAAILIVAQLQPLHRARSLWDVRLTRRRPEMRGTGATAGRGADPDRSEFPATGAPPAPPGPELSFSLLDRLGNFSLELAQEQPVRHLAVLGASGAGKSLTLRCLAGLRGPRTGCAQLGAARIDGLAPEARGVGWVPQDAGLFPHLNVWQQLTFARSASIQSAALWLERLDLEPLRDRLPRELSGGQRQRVALGRALAAHPRLLLLDEPFSSLDMPVRERLRRDLRRLQRELSLTTVIVTHDPDEAALLAEDVIVLDAGRIVQSGPRAEVFGRPASAAVARLLSVDNLRTGRISEPGRIKSEGSELAICDRQLAPGTRVAWCLRAQHARLLPHESNANGDQLASSHPADHAPPRYEAVPVDVCDLGSWREARVRLQGGLELTARSTDGAWLEESRPCLVQIDPRDIVLWVDAAS